MRDLAERLKAFMHNGAQTFINALSVNEDQVTPLYMAVDNLYTKTGECVCERGTPGVAGRRFESM